MAKRYLITLRIQMAVYDNGSMQYQVRKVDTIKQIREFSGLGLREAKDIVDSIELEGHCELIGYRNFLTTIEQVGKLTIMGFEKAFPHLSISDLKILDEVDYIDVTSNQIR